MPLNLNYDVEAPPSAFVQPVKKREGLSPWLVGAPIAAQGLDAYSTGRALSGGREGNPALANVANDSAKLYALKLLTGAGVGFGANEMAKHGHPGWGKAIAGFGTALPMLAGIHNLTRR